MASSSSSTATPNEPDRKRKRVTDSDPQPQAAPSKWRTRREHEIYSTKLLDALRLVRSGASPSPARGGREVRDAANRALAVAARGRSRWSRAILACHSRRRRALRVRLRAPPAPALPPPLATNATSSSSSSARAPALARKAKALGRLVPGCRKLPFPALLSEASDYIAALEMQVRAMAALAQALSSVSAGSSSPA